MTHTDELNCLKLELKQWERDFQKVNGSQPAKEDIKNVPEIALKYKRYRQLKSSKPTTATRHDTVPVNEPEEVEAPNSPEITRVGPTPQLHGRVLGLFDVIPQTPEKSPIKQLTPSKTITGLQSPIISSPAGKFDSTPSYLSRTIAQSLSPLAPRKVRRGLSCLIAELQQIKEETSLTMEEEFVAIDKKIHSTDALELDHLGEEEGGEEEVEERKYKKKGQKRSTKKHKFKARPVDEAGNFDQSAVKVRKTATENYRRLKINSSGGGRRFPFRRR